MDVYSALEFIMYIFMGSLFGGLIGCLICVSLPMDTYDKNYTYEIVALQDNSQVNGQFFLGSGQIDGRMTYVFYYKSGDFFQIEQAIYTDAKVKYLQDAISSPKVTITQKTPKDSFINYFAFDTDLWSKKYVIEVPEGTIRNVQNLDAQ
jgi:hypothetical protein